jgi:hypothetical protein
MKGPFGFQKASLALKAGTEPVCDPSISEEKKLPRYVFIFQLHLWAIASDYIHPLSHRIEITPSQQSNLLEFNQEDPNGLSQRPQVMANLPLRKLINDGAQMGLPSSHQMGMMMKTSHQQTKYWRRKDQWGRVYEILWKKSQRECLWGRSRGGGETRWEKRERVLGEKIKLTKTKWRRRHV